MDIPEDATSSRASIGIDIGKQVFHMKFCWWCAFQGCILASDI